MTFVKLFEPDQLTTQARAVYTAAKLTCITQLTFTNNSAEAVKVIVYLVPASKAVAPATILTQRSLAAGEAWEPSEAKSQALGVGDSLQLWAGKASAITPHGSGWTF